MDAKKFYESQFVNDRGRSRLKFVEIEKAKLVLKGSMQKVHILSELSNGNANDNDLFIKWKKDINDVERKEYKVLRNGEAKKEIERLEIENIYLKQLITDLKMENDKLRKS